MTILHLERGQPPIYRPSLIPEYQGNPLIEALPPIEDDRVVLDKLRHFPEVSAEDRTLPPAARKHMTARVRDLVVPFPEYLDVYRMVETALLRGYAKKNPFSPSTIHYLHYLDPTSTIIPPRTGFFAPAGSAITIDGHSGVGKTHMMVRILGTFPQALQHNSYKNRALDLPQLVWVSVSCPADGSITLFCKALLEAIDKVAGTEALADALRKRYNTGEILTAVRKAVRNLFIGLIVVEEMSNLRPQKNGDAHPLLSFILTLINDSGVPFVFIGNPEMHDVFRQTFKIARRAESGGSATMYPLHPAVWAPYVEKLWRIQLTNPPTPYDITLDQRLRALSHGVPDLASRTFQEAQKCVIGTRDERITLAALDEGQRKALRLTKPMLTWVDEPSTQDAFATSEASASDSGVSQEQSQASQSVDDSGAPSGPRSRLADPDRPQHPEFEQRLHLLLGESDLPLADLDPRAIRDATHSGNILKNLERAGILLSDPLNDLDRL